MLTLDHLVIACPTLEQGMDWAHSTLGVRPAAGGQHVSMGTHNALLRLQDGIYLELIAIDPSLPAPLRPRWFGLDGFASNEPALWHAVVSTRNIATLCQREGQGRAIAMQRKHFNWLISVPDSGELPSPLGAPTLIQWECKEHPASGLADVGLSLESLAIHSAAPGLEALYEGVEQVSINHAKRYSLSARLQTPLGLVELSSN